MCIFIVKPIFQMKGVAQMFWRLKKRFFWIDLYLIMLIDGLIKLGGKQPSVKSSSKWYLVTKKNLYVKHLAIHAVFSIYTYGWTYTFDRIQVMPRSAPALSVINEFLTSLVISAWSLSSSRAKLIVKFQRYLHGHVTMFFSTSQFCIC